MVLSRKSGLRFRLDFRVDVEASKVFLDEIPCEGVAVMLEIVSEEQVVFKLEPDTDLCRIPEVSIVDDNSFKYFENSEEFKNLDMKFFSKTFSTAKRA